MRAAILRAPPGAGKASSHATTRADPCRELPAPGVDNLSLTLITSRDQSEQKPETRTQIPFRFRGSHLKKNRRGYTCSLAGMSSLGRSGRCLHTAETRPTGRSHGKSRRVSQKTDPRKKTERAPQKPTDPWVFGYGKPPWETAAETLWETEVWCLLYPGMVKLLGPNTAKPRSKILHTDLEIHTPRARAPRSRRASRGGSPAASPLSQ